MAFAMPYFLYAVNCFEFEIIKEAFMADNEHKNVPSIVKNGISVIQWLCIAFYFFDVVIVSYVVFGRFILKNTPEWGEEIARLCMVWLALLSANLALESDSHIRMVFADRLFGKTGVKIRNIIFALLNIFFAVFLVIEGAKFSMMTRGSFMPGSKWPTAILYISVPISAVFYVLILIYKLYEEVKSWIKTR